MNLPSELATPSYVADRPSAKVMQDLTVYLRGPTETELDFLLDLYAQLCPPDRIVKYKIAEVPVWPRIDEPVMTASARAAAARGVARAYLEPARKRIREQRAFEAQLWDGREISDDGSWSFNCQRIHVRQTGLHAFVRILIPLDADPAILQRAAHEIAENVEFYSGHGGLTFVYDPWLIASAFDAIYALSRRFWGVEVEHLNGTLMFMRDFVKSANWLTLIAPQLWDPDSADVIRGALAELEQEPSLRVEPRRYGAVITAGPEPVAGDQHRPDASLAPYARVANALERLFMPGHPDFPGPRFIENGNSAGWIRRFIDPEAWR